MKTKTLYLPHLKTAFRKRNKAPHPREGELFLNLASNEYFSAVDDKALKVPVIAPVFKDWSKDKLRVISFYAKKARGAMVRYILDSGADSLEAVRAFDYEGYQFSKEHTLKEQEPVFIR
mgnify:CR=1 FL=1